ncbi:MAG: hypothetical protein ABH824_06325 [Nanoarchaeota archaeon]|nr:hypothetical protein [Nanoarchaeota archaeon]MBU1631810.1 hypothetical protein [Nanoarchaeota archaeon]MBU1875893.1 hypothetical protein [Nanoarchaeota archaeon]
MALKDIILTGAIALTSCHNVRTTPIEEITGKKPTVEYFFSPTCEGCSKGNDYVQKLKDHFGNSINLEMWCIATEENPTKDTLLCREIYDLDSQSGTNRLYYLGHDKVPAWFVNGQKVNSAKELYEHLGFSNDQ